MNSKTFGLSSTEGIVGVDRDALFLVDARVDGGRRDGPAFDARCFGLETVSCVIVVLESLEPFEACVRLEKREVVDGFFRMGVRLDREARLGCEAIPDKGRQDK